MVTDFLSTILPNTTINRGSTGDQVKALQQYLIGLGYPNVKADGIYGPVTESTVKQFQADNGVTADGNFGPQTIAKAQNLSSTGNAAGNPGTGKLPDDPSQMYNTATGQLNDKFQPQNQADLDTWYNSYVAAHPTFAGNSPQAVKDAVASGNFSKLTDSSGKPFSNAAFSSAVDAAGNALAPGFDATKQKDTADLTSSLGANNAAYNTNEVKDVASFQNDKNTLDKTAADNGVLFSGGRYQKENQLANTYQNNAGANAADLATKNGSLANAYQYKYGGIAAAAPSLSSYYNMSTPTYNANVATNGVTQNPLSSAYNPNNYNYQGTAVVAKNAAATTAASGVLANAGNKLLSTGYQNQF